MYAGGPWNQSAFFRGERGVRQFTKTNAVWLRWFQDSPKNKRPHHVTGVSRGRGLVIARTIYKRPNASRDRTIVSRTRSCVGQMTYAYMATGLTQASAREAVPRVLQIYERSNNRALKAAIASSRVVE